MFKQRIEEMKEMEKKTAQEKEGAQEKQWSQKNQKDKEKKRAQERRRLMRSRKQRRGDGNIENERQKSKRRKKQNKNDTDIRQNTVLIYKKNYILCLFTLALKQLVYNFRFCPLHHSSIAGGIIKEHLFARRARSGLG